MLGQELEYQCAPGFRAHQRQPAKSVCEVHCGKVRWTLPQLTCTSEGELDPNPGKYCSMLPIKAGVGSKYPGIVS